MTGPNSLTLNDGKAGMQGLDKERINRIIREASRGSKFYQHAEKKEKELQSKVEKMLDERNSLTAQMIKQSEIELDAVLTRLESTRDLSRDIVHVDMDAFYAAVEMRDNPALRDVPMAVGGSAMLSTSNYLARRYGVRAAMPGFIAKKLCPGLVIVPGNHDKYRAVSAQIMDIIGKYTTEFGALSLDEVYCDMTDLVHSRTVSSDLCPEHGDSSTVGTDRGSPRHSAAATDIDGAQPHEKENSRHSTLARPGVGEECGEVPRSDSCWCRRESVVWNVVQEMRRDIENATLLTASAGLSCNTFLAKVCSDLNKPNGQYLLPSNRETVMDFVAELEIKKVPGIGRVQQAHLAALDIHKVSDLISQRGTLAHLFTAGTVQFYLATALGLGSNQVSSDEAKSKSMSTENTFADTNVNTEDNKLTQQISDILSDLSGTLASRLSDDHLAGETVSIKLKLATFEILQRSRSQTHPVSSKEDIEFIARELLSQLVREQLSGKPPGHRLSARLLGVRVHNFVTSSKQSSLLSFTRGGPSSSTKTWNCPVCDAALPAQIVSFNKHVDSCIVNGEQDTITTGHVVGGDFIEPVPAVEQGPLKSAVEEGPSKPALERGSGESSMLPSVVLGEENKVELELRGKKRKSSEDKLSGERWLCPVCSKSVSSNLATFNLHIDRCLEKVQKSTESDGCASAKKPRTNVTVSERSRTEGHKESLFKYFKRA